MKDTWIEGVARRRVDMLRPGDRIDLQNDSVADPEGDSPVFPFEFAEVEYVMLETTGCVLVVTSQGGFGFPRDHWVEVDAEQVLPDLPNREPITRIGRIYEF